jgi:hypothetical protein
MKSPGPIILGVPVGMLGRFAHLPPWLVIVVVAASLILGLVRAIVPQDSADRLHLLLALGRSKTRPAISPDITTVSGHVTEGQNPDTLRSTPTALPAGLDRSRELNP